MAGEHQQHLTTPKRGPAPRRTWPAMCWSSAPAWWSFCSRSSCSSPD